MAAIATFNFVENDLTDNASQASAEAENSTRQAAVECSYISTGQGQHRIHVPVTFPVIFSTEPHFTSGSGVVKNVGGGVYHDPIGSAGVWQWQVDDRSYYLGAYVWVRVDVYEIDDATEVTSIAAGIKEQRAIQKRIASMKVIHYLTFSGRAIKDLSVKGVTPDLTPRKPGI